MKPAYLLFNPISKIVNKPPQDFQRKDLIKVVQAKKLERITFQYTGLDSKLKELKIPVPSRLQAERILAEGERVDGSSLFKGLMDVAVSDLYVVPDYKTAFINPFDEKSLNIICRYFTADGNLAPFALDNILYSAHCLLQRRHHLQLLAAGELEFYLLSKRDNSVYPCPDRQGYHAAAPFIKSSEILSEMATCISQITGAVKYFHSEVGYVQNVQSQSEEINGKPAEQLEIEFLPTAVEEAADSLVLARWIIRNVSYRHGCVATFTPKLEEEAAGNGLHIHMELRKNGKNVMTRKSGGLSDYARRLVGGLCTYADSLTAFGNTQPSSYLRLTPNQEAPTRICWSDLNRSALIRVPLGWSKATNLAQRLNAQQKNDFKTEPGRQTVELRSPDGSAIVHLLLAGITLATEWGLSHSESLKVAQKLYVQGNIYQDQKLMAGLPALPTSCLESAQILKGKKELYERDSMFPASVIDYLVGMLRNFKDPKMLSELPKGDRKKQIRKIMHQDLHRH
jgi:glutamine synthetase